MLIKSRGASCAFKLFIAIVGTMALVNSIGGADEKVGPSRAVGLEFAPPNWRLNQESTTALYELKSDDIETDWIVLERMARILGELIKSPNKAHPRDYEKEIDALLNEVVRRNESTFTTSRKKKSLQKKYEKKSYSTRGSAV